MKVVKKKSPPRKKVATKRTTNRIPLYAHVVLDRSGSMSSCADESVKGYNEYCQSLGAQDGIKPTISLTIFDDQSIDMIRDSADPVKAKIDRDEFIPRGMTPLYDAIGKTIHEATDRSKGIDRVALVIITDGQENASHEYDKAKIKALLEEKQKKHNWLVVYIGANQDAMAEGAKIGTQRGTTMTFDPRNIGGTFSASASNIRNYAVTGSVASATFTVGQRKAAMKGVVK